MKNVNPSEVKKIQTDAGDPRIGQLLEEGITDPDRADVVILGFPSDEGVRRNGGRPGASEAPDAIRRALYALTPDPEYAEAFTSLLNVTVDLGNLEVNGNLEEDQQKLGEILGKFIKQDTVIVLLGGGHETAFGHFLGYVSAETPTAIVNLDAHADLRPLKDGEAHSGSPFRQAMTHPSDICEGYAVAGLQPHSVARSHLDFLEENGGDYAMCEETNITTFSGMLHRHDSDRLMVTFDMDAVDRAYAPGVSAPCVNGLRPDLWLTAAYLAGRSERVYSFDLSEVNPSYDRDRQTAGLAAVTIWHFLLGLCQRNR